MYKVKYSYCNIMKKLILFLGMIVFAINSNAIGFYYQQWYNGAFSYYNSSNNPWYGNGNSNLNPLQEGGYKTHPNQLDLANLFVIPVVMEDLQLNTYKQCNAVIMGVKHYPTENVDVLLLATTYSCGAFFANGTYHYAKPYVDYVPSIDQASDYSYQFGFKTVGSRGNRRPALVYAPTISRNMLDVVRVFYGTGDLYALPLNTRPLGTQSVIYFALQLDTRNMSAIGNTARNMDALNRVFPNIVAPERQIYYPANIDEVHLASYGNIPIGLGDTLRSSPVARTDGYSVNQLNVVYESSGVLTPPIGKYHLVLSYGDDGGYIALGFIESYYPNIVGMLNFARDRALIGAPPKTLVGEGKARMLDDRSNFPPPVNRINREGYQFFTPDDIAEAQRILSTF